MKGKAILVISLMLGAMVASSSFARAAVIQAPSWVPNKVAGWDLVYNSTIQPPSLGNITFDLGTGLAIPIVSNWTQMWIKNDSTAGVTGTLATADLEFDKDYFSQPLNATLKAAINKFMPTGQSFTGNTVWDLFFWIMNSTFTNNGEESGVDASFSDETKNITGAMGACSFNMSAGGTNLYVLFAYSGKYAMIITSLDIPASLSEWLSSDDLADMGTFMQLYVGLIVYMFVIILGTFATINNAQIPSTSAIIPRSATTAPTSTKTSKDDVKAFASTFVSTATPPTVPAYPLFMLGAFGVVGVALVVRKRKMLVA